MKSIFLVENDINVKDAICLQIEHQPDLMVLGTADHTSCILAEVCKQKPDVVLVDWFICGIDYKRLFIAMRKCRPEVLIIATSVRPENEKGALELGADDFLLKQLPPEKFIAALQTAVMKQDCAMKLKRKEQQWNITKIQ